MDTFLQQIFTILTTQPGNIVYHLILAFSVVAGLQGAIIARRNNPDAVPTRLLTGLSILLAAQLVLFFSSGLAWQQVADPQRYLPPLDRSITTFSLAWIIWLWCFPRPSRAADAVTVILSLVVIILGLFTYSSWSQETPAAAFNGSWYDWGWQIFALALSILGLLVLIIGRPPAWGTGLAALGLILAGYIANLLLAPTSGFFSGVVRLAQLCAYPLLPVLAHRLVQAPAPAAPLEPETRQTLEPRLVQSWLQVAAEDEPHRLSAALARAIGQAMRADLCFLIAAPDARDRWLLLGGRDLVSEQDLPQIALESEKIPNLSAALLRGRSTQLPQPGQPEPIDLDWLGESFGLNDANSLMAAPLISAGKVIGGIVLFLHYSAHAWTPEEQSQLMTIAELVVPVYQRASEQSALAARQTEAEELQRQNAALQSEITNLRAEANRPAPAFDVDSLVALQNEMQAENTRLQAELEQLRSTLTQPSASSQAEMELRMALEDNAYLRNDLAEAQARIEVLKHAIRPENGSGESAGLNPALITGICQQLRQPMEYLLSYLNLTLAETAGSLDATQLGYLDRMKTSVYRMRTLLDDLARAAHTPEMTLNIQPVDVGAIIDSAANTTESLLREKNISLRLDIPPQFPAFRADESALRQILVDLLRNAVSITPESGSVLLRAQVEMNGTGPHLLLQVEDHGSGLSQPDIEHVFQPGAGSGISGVADGGYGLAVTHSLVEALGGKIWVESEPGKAATYLVKLPSARTASEA